MIAKYRKKQQNLLDPSRREYARLVGKQKDRNLLKEPGFPDELQE